MQSVGGELNNYEAVFPFFPYESSLQGHALGSRSKSLTLGS